MPDESVKTDRPDAAWTPTRGMLRGALAGIAVAGVLGLALFGIAYAAPVVTLNFALRVAIAFGVTWLVFLAMQRAAGMVGWPVTTLAVVFSLLAVLATHAAYAISGVHTAGRFGAPDVVAGWTAWFSPGTLLVANLSTLIGVGICAWREHEG